VKRVSERVNEWFVFVCHGVRVLGECVWACLGLVLVKKKVKLN